MTSLTVLIPVLNRPERAEPVLRSLAESLADEPVDGDALFLCTPGDQHEIEELQRLRAPHAVVGQRNGWGEYPRKINHGARITGSEWLLLGADDITFAPGWFATAMRAHDQTGALVIGTQDCGNDLVKRGLHSTHPLVHRSYVGQGTMDNTGLLLHEGYDHNSCDVEFVETAMHRGVWTFAGDSIVRHDHPLWSRGKVRRDATYVKGMRNAGRDRVLLNTRRHLWGGRMDPGAAAMAARYGRHPIMTRARVSVMRPRP